MFICGLFVAINYANFYTMKSKLKKPVDTAKMNVSAYTVKLKTDLATLTALPAEERPSPFVLHLDYNFADEESTLFVVGLSNDWKKHIKTAAWLKTPLSRQTWLGTCEIIGEDMHLLVKKGKIVRSQFNAAIKKNPALKKLNWIITEELSDEEDDDLLNDEEEKEAEAAVDNQQDKAKAAEINVQLVKLIPNLKGANTEEKRALLVQIEQLADALYAIPNWESYTDDSIERYLQQIERFLVQQQALDAEKVEEVETPAEQATKLSQQLTVYLGAFKKAATTGDKQKIMAAMQAAAAKLYAVPDWKTHTDDRLEAILAQLPKPKATENNTSDDSFIIDHKAKINEMTTVEAVAEHSKTIAKLASSPEQKAFAATVAEYAAHLEQANVLINENLDAQAELNELLGNSETPQADKEKAAATLKALEAALSTILN